MTDAIVIPLEFWQDPQGDVILIYSEHECSVYLACWKSTGEPADFIGHLSFEHASVVRSFTREFLPYRLPRHDHRSYILRIPESELIHEHVAYRQQRYPHMPTLPTPNHYVVVGHDIYHEILANSLVAGTIPNPNVIDPRLRRLIALG